MKTKTILILLVLLMSTTYGQIAISDIENPDGWIGPWLLIDSAYERQIKLIDGVVWAILAGDYEEVGTYNFYNPCLLDVPDSFPLLRIRIAGAVYFFERSAIDGNASNIVGVALVDSYDEYRKITGKLSSVAVLVRVGK